VLPNGFSESVFASGLTLPTAMAVAQDGRIFVAEKGGTLRVVQNQTVLPTPFLSVAVDDFSERGLIGVALDPNFQSNGFVYVYYTTDQMAFGKLVNRVSRFTADPANPNVALAGSERVLVDDIASTNGNHNGGALLFRPDGMLYVAVGEAGVPANSQSLANLSGKILRIDPATGQAAPGNPTTIAGLGAVPPAQSRIWAAGLRNPFTMAVQPGTGRLFINDVGGALFEEINEGIAGANYGWSLTEGDFNQAAFPNFTRPVYAYAHGRGPLQGNTIAGGAFYNPATPMFPTEYTNDYFFGEFINGRIYLRDSGTGVVTTFGDQLTGKSPVDLDLGLAGQLLYLDIVGGTIYQITFSPPIVTASVVAVGTGPGPASQLVAINTDGSTRFMVNAYPGYFGGVRVASGDVTGDGIEDIITGTGPGAPPHVKVFDGATGGLVRSFFAFAGGFSGGLNVAAGDVTGDGRADIIVSSASGAAHVKAFDAVSGAEVRSFFAYPGFTGGVTVAAGDVDGDGRTDIITGSATGPAHVKVFSGTSGALVRSFLVFGSGYSGGVSVGFAGGGIVAGAAVGPPHVKVFNADLSERLSFFAFPPTFRGGVRVGGNGNSVMVGVGPGAGPHLKLFDALSGVQLDSRFAFAPSTPGGIFVG